MAQIPLLPSGLLSIQSESEKSFMTEMSGVIICFSQVRLEMQLIAHHLH